MKSRMNDLETFQDVDVLFLGSSHAYRGFDPRIFAQHGIKSFNLGSSSQTPIQTEILVKRYLDRLNPNLVILEVFPSTLANDGVESALELIANDKNDLWSLKMAYDLKNVIVFNTLIHCAIVDLLGWDDLYIEPLKRGKDRYIRGGYVERKITAFKGKKSYPSEKRNMLKSQKRALERTINTIKRLNYNLIIVQTPVTRKYYESFLDHDEIDAYLTSLATYYNFNKMLNLSDSQYFYDYHHLNQNGVEIFNEALISVMHTNNHL